jgi:hypothetical protein
MDRSCAVRFAGDLRSLEMWERVCLAEELADLEGFERAIPCATPGGTTRS